ncbi:alanine dehydrogenase [Balneolaceae bacterium ANBcel3]|nr:alanine dehydrogenase [Balneolaceae bacterium ANBcel3]
MIIGVPREVKLHENRVAVIPSGVLTLKKRGHRVLMEKDAGTGSGFSDEQYRKCGAEIVPEAKEVWANAELIVKVKEPVPQEYPLMREGQTLFTFFHFAASESLTRAVIESGCVALAYETVEKPDRSLPLLIPMSEVAGKMATQQGARFLEKPQGGKGVMLGGIPGVRPGNVLVLGGGIVGMNASRIAAGMGANVTIMDISLPRLRYLSETMPANVTMLYSSEENIRAKLPEVDLVIGGILIPGAKAPRLITRDMLGTMVPGSVIVDVAIDQGGSVETSRPTTHQDPVYEVDGIVHYGVTNMPGAVPYTSTIGLTNATFPYVLQIADKGWKQALKENAELVPGLNIAYGTITYKDVAIAFDMDWKPVSSVMG